MHDHEVDTSISSAMNSQQIMRNFKWIKLILMPCTQSK